MKNFIHIKLLIVLFIGLLVSPNAANSQTVIYSEDFEGATTMTYNSSANPLDGLPNCEYSENSSGRLRFNMVSHNGSYAALFDSYGYTQNYLILTYDMSSYTSSNYINLQFYFADYGDESSAGDAVWVRGNNTDSWLSIYNLDPGSRTNFNWNFVNNLDVSSLLSANGQSFSSTFQVRFGQYDNVNYSTDGIAFDDISIVDLEGVYATDIIHKEFSTCNLSNDTVKVEITNKTPSSVSNFSVGLTVTNPDLTTNSYDVTFGATLASGAKGYVFFNNVDMSQVGDYKIVATPSASSVSNFADSGAFTMKEAYPIPWTEDFTSTEDKYWDLGNNFSWISSYIYQYLNNSDTLVTPAINISKEDYYFTYQFLSNNISSADTVLVQISTGCSNTYSTIDTVIGGGIRNGDFNTYNQSYVSGYDLSSYLGENVQIRYVTLFSANRYFYLKDINIKDGNDIKSDDILLSNHPYFGTDEYPISVVVFNNAAKTQTSVDVNLQVYGGVSANISKTFPVNLAYGEYDTLYMGTINATNVSQYELIATATIPNDYDSTNNVATTTFTIDASKELPISLQTSFNTKHWGYVSSSPGVQFFTSYIQSEGIYRGESASFVSYKMGEVVKNSFMSFDYKILGYDNSSNHTNYLGSDDTIKVLVSDDYNKTFVEVYSIDSTMYSGNGSFQKTSSIDLSAYVGKDISFKIEMVNGSGTDNVNLMYVYLNNFYIGAADVSVESINTSDVEAWCGNDNANFNVTFANNSNVDAVNIPYTFQLIGDNFNDVTYSGVISKIDANTQEIVSIGSYDVTNPGEYHASAFSQYENDNVSSNNSISNQQFSIFNWRVTPYVEDFTQNPSDWDLSDGFTYTSGSYLGGNGLIFSQMYVGDSKSAESAVIGTIQSGDFIAFNFSVKAFKDNLNTYLGEYIRENDSVNVLVSDDCGSTWTQVYSINNGNYSNPSAEYTFVSNIDLSAYVNKQIRVKFNSVKHNPVGEYQFVIDDFHVISTGDAGVTAVKFPQYTSNVAVCGTTSDQVMVVVHNYGRGTVSNIPVVVKQIFSGDTIATKSTTIASLAPDANDTVYVSGFNTVQSGDYGFYAYTNIDGDLDDSNDDFTVTTLKVQKLATIPYLNAGNTVPSNWQFYHAGSEASWASDGTYINTPDLNEGDTAFMTLQKVGVIENNYKLRIAYKVDAYDNDGNFVGNYLRDNDKIEVQVSDDCGQTYSAVNTLTSANHVNSSNDSVLIIDLSSFASKSIVVRLFAVKGSIGSMNVLYKYINLTVPDGDVDLTQIYAQDGICGSTSEPIYAVVQNNAVYESISNFTINATVEVNNASFATMNTTYTGVLMPGDVDTVLVGTFSSETPQVYDVSASVTLDGDVDNSNNDLSNYSFTIYDVQNNDYSNDFNDNADMWKMKGNFSYTGSKLSTSSLAPNDTAIVYSPKIGSIGINNYVQFDFGVTGSFAIGDRIELFVSNDCGASYTKIHTIENDANLNTFVGSTQKVSLSSYQGDELIFKFVVYNVNGDNFTATIDNFEILYSDVKILGIVNQTDIFDINTYNPADGTFNYIERYITCGSATDSLFVVFENTGKTTITSVPVTINVSGKITQTLSQTFSGSIEPGEKAWIYVGTVDSETPGLMDMEASVNVTDDNNSSNNITGFSVTTQATYALPFDAFSNNNFNESYFWKYDANGEMAQVGGASADLVANNLTEQETGYAISPKLHVGDQGYLFFDYTVNNTLNEGHIIHDELLEVLVSTNCSPTFTQIWHIDVTTTDLASEGTIALDLSAYAGDDIRVMFRAVKGYSEGVFQATFDQIQLLNYAPVEAIATYSGDTLPKTGATVCEGSVLSLSTAHTGLLGITNFEWKFQNADTSYVIGNSSWLSVNIAKYNTGNFILRGWGDELNTEFTDQVSITVSPLPELPVIHGDSAVVTNIQTTDYSATSTYADTYIWDIGGAGNIESDTSSAIVTWPENGYVGKAYVMVTGENECGMGKQATLPVDVEYLNPNNGDYSWNKEGEILNSSNGIVQTYPNPSNGHFFVELPKNTDSFIVEVKNNIGVTVANKIVYGDKGDINISGQSEGIYHIRVIVDNRVYIKSIVVK